jgi:hypothetical protein
MRSVARTLSQLCMVLLTSGTLIANDSLAEGNNKNKNRVLPDAMMIPASGITAKMQGLEVVLNKDGSWRLQDRSSLDSMVAITSNGDTVKLHFSQDANGIPQRTWDYFGQGIGPIQIVVSHATSTANSPHSTDDNCIPALKVRNLTELSVDQLVFEIEFRGTENQRGGLSMMTGNIDNGEEQELTGPALLVNRCEGLIGHVNIPYCVFKNGAPCNSAVVASEFGAIPLKRKNNNSENARAAR